MDRPDWDTYFMTLCFLVSQRSLDEFTKHGTVVVAPDKTILSTGYNSPPRGFNDAEFPQTRPLKYSYVIHSETNAIVNAARHGICLKDSTFYITGFPCQNCFHGIINVGAKEVVYGFLGSNCVNEETVRIVEHLNKYAGINMRCIKPDVSQLLDLTKEYHSRKVPK